MKGVYTAVVTPFTKEDKIDEEAFIKLMGTQEEANIDGIIIGGTTGEGWSLEDDEVALLYHIARRVFSGEVIIGTTAISTKEALRKTKQAKELGADSVLVAVSPYVLPSEAGIVEHYSQIANIGIPVVAYHHPGRTGVRLSFSCLKEIAMIDGVVAIKEASGDLSLIKELSAVTQVFAGNDDQIVSAKQLGAVGVMSVVSNLFPRETKGLVASTVKELPIFFEKILKDLYREVNPLGIKAALAEKNIIQDFVRKPLMPLSERGRVGIKKMLARVKDKEFANK